MADSKIAVGIDIGSSKIATIIGQIQEEGINILGVSEVPSRGIRKGQIVDIEEAAFSINASLDAAERDARMIVEATCTYSQPAPAESTRRLSVTRCPGRRNRPSFLMSRWIISPGVGFAPPVFRVCLG